MKFETLCLHADGNKKDGVESLITYPMLQTHADVPKEERERRGINDRFLRLSVGIENVNDLIEDLKRVFDK